MARVVRRVLAACVCVIALAGCRLDVAVDMTVEPDGTGTISILATADPELVAAVPTIADDLATDDVVAAGWVVDGPSPTPDGGLTITFTHGFFSDEEATNLLNSLGPPFNEMSMVRNSSGENTTTRFTGLLGLPDGFASFADDDLVAAVGSVPFADQIAASGATPASSMGVTMRAALPGNLDQSQTNGTLIDERPTRVGRATRRQCARRTSRLRSVTGRRPVVGTSTVRARTGGVGRLGHLHDALHRLRRLGTLATHASPPAGSALSRNPRRGCAIVAHA